MKFWNALGKLMIVKFYAVVLLVGLAFAGFGGYAAFRPHGEYKKVPAEVMDVYWEERSDDSVYILTIRYIVDGVVYGGEYTGSGEEEPGDFVTIEYDVDRPENYQSPGGEWIPYLFFGLGIVISLVGIALIVGACRRNTEMPEGTGAPEFACDPTAGETGAAESFWAGERTTYYFHNTGKMSQSYVLKTADQTPRYEAILQSGSLFKPYVYEFVNHTNEYRRTHTVGKVVTRSPGQEREYYAAGIAATSSFSFDGEKIWNKVIAMGYGFDFTVNGFAPCYTVRRYGKPVATVKTIGYGAAKEASEEKGGIPVNGCFRVVCSEEDLDGVFLICFGIARAMDLTS